MKYLLWLFTVSFLSAQPVRVGGNGEKALIVVPMVGAGTFADPKRPAFVREAGMAFRFQVSDDGASAIVEVSPRGPLDLAKLEERLKTDARTKVFRPGKDRASDVLVELRKVKKDFDIDSFGKAGATLTPAN